MKTREQIKAIEKRRHKRETSEEYQQFETLIDDSRKLFNPDIATLQRQVAPGTKLEKRRVSDVGISMNSDYASGMLAETITSGDEWFELADVKKGSDIDDMLEGMTSLMFDYINHSNYYSEMHRDQYNAGSDGTVCMHSDWVSGKVVHTHTPFGHFWFEQDFDGKPSTVWVEKKTTAGALASKFGVDALSTKLRQCADSQPDKEVCIIYYCAPRLNRDMTKVDNLNKAFEYCIYEKDECHPLFEGGTDLQKFSIYRVKRRGDETLGRGPCIDALCSMNALERTEKDFQRAARLMGVPIYGIPASLGQNGVKWIHNDDASIMVYDDTGIAGPPQTMNPQVNPDPLLAYGEKVAAGMSKIFYLDYFNPVMDKKNLTAYQAREIVNKSQNMVGQITEPFLEERIDPSLRWLMIHLGEAGVFEEWGSWQEIQAKLRGRVTIRHKSRLANAQKRLRLLSIVEYTEMKGIIAQSIPDPVMQYEFMAQTDYTNVPQELINGTNAPQTLLRDPEDAKSMAKDFADALAERQQMDNMVKGADAVSKGSGEIHPNSAVAQLM